MNNKNKRKSLLAITLATSLSLSGCKNTITNYDNSDSNTYNNQTTNYNNYEPTKEELQELSEKNYYDYFDSYEVKYLHPEYLTSDEELENFQKMLDSYQECTHTYFGTAKEMMNTISQNTDTYIIEHPNFNYVNATNTDYALNLPLNANSFSNYLKFLINSKIVLEDFIESLIDNELSSNTNEDLCRMQDLVVVLDTNSVPDTDAESFSLAEYDPDENKIIIFLNNFLVKYDSESDSYITYDINVPNSIPDEQFDLFQKSIAHELNHMRETTCNDRIENGQTYSEISYDNEVVTSLIESAAESAIYDEKGATYNYENSSDNSHSYYFEREFENELLLLSLTDNSSTLDDYYSSIFNSDWNSLIKFFNLKSNNDIKSFLNILKSSDAIFLRNNIAFDIENISIHKSMTTGQARNVVGTNYRIDILRLALRNLIEYNMNSNVKLTAEEMITLEKIIIYQIFYKSSIPKLDENGEFLEDENNNLITTYDPTFTRQAFELEKKFYEYIIQTYDITNEELTEIENLATANVDDMNYYTPNQLYYYENSTANSLFEKFPKLKNIIPGLNDVSDYNYNRALTPSTSK